MQRADVIGVMSPGQILTGSLFNEPMRVETVQANGPVELGGGPGGNALRAIPQGHAHC